MCPEKARPPGFLWLVIPHPCIHKISLIALPVQQPFSFEQLEFEMEIQGTQLILQSFEAKAFDGTFLA